MEQASKLKQVRVIFTLNLIMTIWSLAIVIKTAGTQPEWKMFAAVAGFLGLLSITVMLFRRMIKLQKTL